MLTVCAPMPSVAVQRHCCAGVVKRCCTKDSAWPAGQVLAAVVVGAAVGCDCGLCAAASICKPAFVGVVGQLTNKQQVLGKLSRQLHVHCGALPRVAVS